MAIDAIIRVSFESSPRANQAADTALVGDGTTSRAFEKVGTAAYACHNADDKAVGDALADLGRVLKEYASLLDFASVTLLRRPASGRQWSEIRAAAPSHPAP